MQPKQQDRRRTKRQVRLVGYLLRVALHKLLSDAGVRLSVVLSDLNGKSARAMIKGLLTGETSQQVLKYARHRLKASEEE